MVESDHNQAWYLISFAARLCMDSGLNRLKDNSDDIDELNRKKMVFWFTYAFDKAMSLNFGRSPNFSDVSPASQSRIQGSFLSLDICLECSIVLDTFVFSLE